MIIKTTYKAKNLGSKSGGGKRKIHGIVLHDTAGNGGIGDVRYLADDPERRGVSVDFVVPKDGVVYQLNPDPERYWTFHAGRKTKWRTFTNASVNPATIGIEIAQKAVIPKDNPYPEVQVRAVADLCRHLCKTYNLTKADITTHKAIITDGSRSDPRQFPWERFWAIFNKDPEVSGCTVLGDRVYHIVKPGDTLYALARKYSTTVELIKALNKMNTASNLITVGQELLVKE